MTNNNWPALSVCMCINNKTKTQRGDQNISKSHTSGGDIIQSTVIAVTILYGKRAVEV